MDGLLDVSWDRGSGSSGTWPRRSRLAPSGRSGFASHAQREDYKQMYAAPCRRSCKISSRSWTPCRRDVESCAGRCRGVEEVHSSRSSAPRCTGLVLAERVVPDVLVAEYAYGT